MASIRTVLCLLAISLCSSVGSLDNETPDLSQLTGDWVMEENGRWTRESWGKVNLDVVEGNAQSGVGAKADFSEKMRIVKDVKGNVTLFVKLGGETSETPFRLVSTAYQQLMFENLKNDYPQRIIYSRNGGWLFAKIMMADGSRYADFVYRTANPPRATAAQPVPNAKQVEDAVTLSHRCVDRDGYTNCLPPQRTRIRNMVCWPMLDMKGYIEPYRSSPAAECSFEAHEQPITPLMLIGEGNGKPKITWRASWARLHFLKPDYCPNDNCKREWYIPRN